MADSTITLTYTVTATVVHDRKKWPPTLTDAQIEAFESLPANAGPAVARIIDQRGKLKGTYTVTVTQTDP